MPIKHNCCYIIEVFKMDEMDKVDEQPWTKWSLEVHFSPFRPLCPFRPSLDEEMSYARSLVSANLLV